jgi:hypothetical protein
VGEQSAHNTDLLSVLVVWALGNSLSIRTEPIRSPTLLVLLPGNSPRERIPATTDVVPVDAVTCLALQLVVGARASQQLSSAVAGRHRADAQARQG